MSPTTQSSTPGVCTISNPRTGSLRRCNSATTARPMRPAEPTTKTMLLSILCSILRPDQSIGSARVCRTGSGTELSHTTDLHPGQHLSLNQQAPAAVQAHQSLAALLQQFTLASVSASLGCWTIPRPTA